MAPPGQALLKRREGTSKEEFIKSYKDHGRLVLPWCLANEVVYYAQIHNPHWSSSDTAGKYGDVKLSDFDAAAEMAFQKDTSPRFEGTYWHTVILPDERRFLLSEAMKHMKVVEPDSVVGERVEFIVDGKPTVAFDEWQERWEECRNTPS